MNSGIFGARLKAFDQNQAVAYVGATVRFDPEHEDNEDDQMSQALADVEGKVIGGMVHLGEFNVTVMFETEMFSGVIAAPSDRFLIKMDA
jgi:hypothetical protein